MCEWLACAYAPLLFKIEDIGSQLNNTCGVMWEIYPRDDRSVPPPPGVVCMYPSCFLSFRPRDHAYTPDGSVVQDPVARVPQASSILQRERGKSLFQTLCAFAAHFSSDRESHACAVLSLVCEFHAAGHRVPALMSSICLNWNSMSIPPLAFFRRMLRFPSAIRHPATD